MSQAIESIVIIINETPSPINKKENYKELLQKVIPFTKSENEIVKRAAYDFHILLKSAINEENSKTFLFLNEGIEHAIEHFTVELTDLINNRIDPDINSNDTNYGLVNDVAKVICQQLLFRNKLPELKKFLMEM
jgi:hypothetical protein